MMSFKAVAGLTLLSQALALPMFYNDKRMGCEIPQQGFKGHSAPTLDDTITIVVTDADGVAVTEWEAGTEYTLAISSYAPLTNAWIHSTGGTLAPGVGYALADCGEAVYSQNGAATHEVTWTAPPDTSACVTVSTAQASGPAEGYNTNTFELCAAGGAATPMAAAGVPVAAPEPVEAEMMEEEGDLEEGAEEVEEGLEEAEEAVEDAAEGATDTVEDTDSVAGVTGVVTAVVAAAVAVLAA